MALSTDTKNRMNVALALATAGTELAAAVDALSPPTGVTGDVAITLGVSTIGAGKVVQTMISPASLDGTTAKVVATSNVIGGEMVIHMITLAAGALADTDVILTHKTRVIDCWIVLTTAGIASTTLQVKNAANAISSLMAASGADQALVRNASIDDAFHEIAAGGTLRVTSATGATQPGAIVYVKGFRVA